MMTTFIVILLGFALGFLVCRVVRFDCPPIEQKVMVIALDFWEEKRGEVGWFVVCQKCMRCESFESSNNIYWRGLGWGKMFNHWLCPDCLLIAKKLQDSADNNTKEFLEE